MPLDDATIPPNAHARLVNPRANGGLTVLRRGYSYDQGTGADGRADVGLLLLLYQRDPRRQFIPLQRHLAQHDALSRFLRRSLAASSPSHPERSPGMPSLTTSPPPVDVTERARA